MQKSKTAPRDRSFGAGFRGAGKSGAILRRIGNTLNNMKKVSLLIIALVCAVVFFTADDAQVMYATFGIGVVSIYLVCKLHAADAAAKLANNSQPYHD